MKSLMHVIFYLTISYLCVEKIPAQTNAEWTNFIGSKGLNDIDFEKGYAWVSIHGGGVVRINVQSKEITYFNTINTGLPENLVTSLAIDRHGHKWFGTYWRGLVKFDGLDWTVYDEKNADLPSSCIMKIRFDQTNNIWISMGYDEGIAKFDGQNWTFYQNCPYNNNVGNFLVDINDNKWISFSGKGGIAKFDGKNWEIYNQSNSILPLDFVQSMASDKYGNLWVVPFQWKGVAVYNGKSWRKYNTANSSIPFDQISRVSIDGNGDPLVASVNGELAVLNVEKWKKFYTIPHISEQTDKISFLKADKWGNLWIGTRQGRLMKWHQGTVTKYPLANSGLPSNNINTTALDSTGYKWFGTNEGLVRYKGSAWIVYTTANSGLPSNHVNCITVDAENNKWIGTAFNGVAKFDGKNWDVYNPKNSGLPDSKVNTIAIDKNGNKWIGTCSGGIAVFDDVQWTVFNKNNSELLDNFIHCIAIDTNGNKWIGTRSGGLLKFDGKNGFAFRKTIGDLPSNNIKVIKIDRKNNKWIGTFRNGLAKFDDKKWIRYPELSRQYIYDIAIDNYDQKWIGMRDGGVARFDGYEWKIFTPKNSPLPSDHIKTILIDNDNNKWFGTWYGGLVLYKEIEINSRELEKEIVELVGFDPLVYEAQKRLEKLGYELGQIDGILGKKTKLAVLAFQEDTDLKRNGILNTATLTKLDISELMQSIQKENWLTLEIPMIKLSLSVPTFSKKILIRPGPEKWIRVYDGRIQNYQLTYGADWIELKDNEYFLEYTVIKNKNLDFDGLKKDFSSKLPQKYSRFEHAFTYTPHNIAEGSLTHALYIWENGISYDFAIDASKLSPSTVERIFASIELR